MSTLLLVGDRGLGGALRQLEGAISDATADELPELLGELERLRAAAWSRLAVPNRAEADVDRLLDAREAAGILGIEVTALYRKRWPFRVEVSRGRTRYSLQGIQRFIRSREGRQAS